ncbi:regulatory protein, luxR family [Flavobacterium fluvii]|uniref:Regulatory protein, luxR family n=1 Tax=Flavobacterium fluvii TaxID=468056 RepID=A0A1M5KFV5_9FLAO|nr:helix-turn-helix transcriptional regulator [Flavobacterium fluvii]SHG51063.1 regulatory protein, luxR family [Flavobacterium fluvii]
MKTNLTTREIICTSRQQLFTLENKIHKGDFSLETIGDYLPGNILVIDLTKVATIYMNNCGCNILKHNVEELAELGPGYFNHFFVPDEINKIVASYYVMQKNQEKERILNFVHRVKALDETSYKWYFASAKLLYTPGQLVSDKIILSVNEVNSLGTVAKKINSVLEESDWMKKNFAKYCRLTPKEKEIISLLVLGNNNAAISDTLFITKLTINTHRRNIKQKLEIKTFSELYKFATAFGLSPS